MATPTWRATAFLATAVDARWREPRAGLRRGREHRLDRRMEAAEIRASEAVLRRVPAAIESWSEGAVALEWLAVERLDRPTATLTPVGDGRGWGGAAGRRGG